MADRNMKFTLDFLAKTAGLKNATELLEQMGDEFDDTVDGGKKLAAAMRVVADRVEADLEQTRKVAESLGNALGPELSQKIGQGRLDQFATNLRAAGLSAEQVDQNIDDIADSVRRLDAATNTADDLGASMHRVASETDQSRNVMANFAGNAAQELPGVAGAFGPLNMAISQFTEYAADGNIKLKNLAGMGAGIGVVSLAMYGLQKHAEKVKKAIEGVSDAAERASRVSDQMALQELAQSMVDLTAAGEDATQTFDTYAQTNLEGAKRVRDLAIQQGMAQGVIDGLTDAILREEAARKQQTETEHKYGDVLSDSTDATYDSVDALTAQDKALRENEQAIKDQADAIRESLDATFDYEEATLATADAVDDLRAQEAETNAVLNDGTATAEEKAAALRDLRSAQIDTAKAAFDQAAAFAAEKGATAGSKDEAQLMIGQLQLLADQYPELRSEIDLYIAKLKQIPGVINTNINVNYNSNLGPIGAKDSTGQVPKRAAGGPVSADQVYMVGENGPELFVSSEAGQIVPNNKMGSAVAMGSGVTITIQNVNASSYEGGLAAGRGIVDAVTAAFKDGVRAPWMAG